VTFRDRLLATLRCIAPVLEVKGVLVIGSEVPNLLERGAASTLVISQDVDIGIPISAHAEVKRQLELVSGLRPSSEEPSVWLPADATCIEVNFVGFDPSSSDPGSTWVFEDEALPLMVFGALSFLREGPPIHAEGLRVPVPRIAGLLLEKLVTDRTGEKGDRDLLVCAGLIEVSTPGDLDELVETLAGLSKEIKQTIRANLSSLSLLPKLAGMPDPELSRGPIAVLLSRVGDR